jgi:predicted nucleic acid-binding protein
MILVDTSVSVDHLRASDKGLSTLLEAGRVLVHLFVIGEIALGHLRKRDTILAALRRLPHATAATDPEVLMFIEERSLMGIGIGYVDAHLLASTGLSAEAALWTRAKRLLSAVKRMGLNWREDMSRGR